MDVLQDYVSPPSLPLLLDGSPGVTAVARANGISGPVAHKLSIYLRQKAMKMDAFIAELVKATEYCGVKHVQKALVTTLGIDALESIKLVSILVPKDNNERRDRFLILGITWDTLSSALAKKDKLKGAVKKTTDVVDLKNLGKRWMVALFKSLTGESLSKLQQEDKATYDAVYDALKTKLQNAMVNHQSEKKKSDFFKAIGLTTADKAKIETVATMDAVRATELFKEWVTAHVEGRTQPAGQERKKSNHTAATEGQANVMETQQEPLGQKSSRQDGDEGDDGDYSGEDDGEGREDEGEGGEDDGEGGEDEGEGECAEDEGGEDEGGEDGDWPYESGDYMGGEDEDWEDKGGEDEGGEDEGGEDDEGTGGKALLEEYGRSKSQKVHSKSAPQPTGRRKVLKDKLKGAVKKTTDVVDLKNLGKRWMVALFKSLTGESLSKLQQEDKAMYDAVYDALKTKLQNAMVNHQSEKKKLDFFKAIGLTTADKAKLETVATMDAVRATELFKEWVTAHVEGSTQPAGQERKKSNHTAATEGQANVMETQQEPLGQKSSRQDGDEGDDGDYSGEDDGEGREDEGEGGEDDGEGGEDEGEGECAEDEGGEDEGGEDGDWPYESGDYMGGEDEDWEDKGGEDEGGEDEGGEDDEGTGGKALLEEYGRSKSQKVHSKSAPQPTGRRKVLVTGKHDKGALDARGRPTRLRQPSAKARESQETVGMVVPARTKRPRPKETPLVLPEDPSAFGATASNPAKRRESFGVGKGRAVQTRGAKVPQEKGKKAMAEIRKGGLKKQRSGEDDGEGREDEGEGGEDDGEGGEDEGEGECAEDEGREDEGGEDGDWPYESGDYMGGEDEDWEDKGGEDEGGEDEGGEDDEGTGGKVLLEEYGRSKSQKVHSKSAPQPTGRRKVLVTGKHDKGALDARGRPTRLRQPSAKARESQETVGMVVPARTKRPRPKETPLVLPEDPSAFGATASNPAKRKESFGVGKGRAVQTRGSKVQQEKGKKAMAEIRKGGLKKQRR
ncbi:hypothetical protein VOLCADRAFT_108186 [Volvox carteri f. nagariensis]|uniref:Uncharacterized protein n=1 Tax=Volvox carteri f. nagariensis TaxID=3068 RepID=D8UIT4_VOLCA|nr:uncharacterized protein VOLCADRAFT_108186 [Volvox carteri f. nagariensis]EFJ40362.1 hypothetical protein VOLCADRAFT_108186 [Volvox carteri f. nagariensis]|eukprot:XP_002958566.1 hypothetical protein VOLCADRAFT_108186 [Volvox carteri f. nagariensis]